MLVGLALALSRKILKIPTPMADAVRIKTHTLALEEVTCNNSQAGNKTLTQSKPREAGGHWPLKLDPLSVVNSLLGWSKDHVFGARVA